MQMKHIIEHNRLTLSIHISIMGGLLSSAAYSIIGKIVSIIGWFILVINLGMFVNYAKITYKYSLQKFELQSTKTDL